jgi:hypothetical protein
MAGEMWSSSVFGESAWKWKVLLLLLLLTVNRKVRVIKKE